jgi:diaminohydroxyphosphoribosylaminopyrimidine deaminase/5-amino-6-(5-phosphoribosylamino)uracil reductase
LPKTLKLFNSKTPTIVFNLHKHSLPEKTDPEGLKNAGVGYYQVTSDVSLVHQVMNALYRSGIQSVLVEGGTYLLQSFIDEGIWDEARVITNEELTIDDGLPAPVLNAHQLKYSETNLTDTIRIYTHSDL